MFKSTETIPVGIFDSGVGGLSVWREMLKLLPGNRFFYLADSAYCPYGPKTKEEIIERAGAITKFFIAQGAEAIVVACNTATSAAIASLREEFTVPFIGMEPAVKPAASLTKTGVIGVLATKGTLEGKMYNSSLKKYAKNIEVVQRVGKGLVPLVEKGKLEGGETERLLKSYILPMVERGADHIVLGCTHYPFLKESIQKIAGDGVTLVDPAPAVARRVYSVVKEIAETKGYREIPLSGIDLYKSCYCDTTFYSTGDITVLKNLARSIIPQIPDNLFLEIEV